MNNILFVLLVFLSFSTFAQNNQIDNIEGAIKDIVQISVVDIGGQKYVIRTVNTLDSIHYLHSFVSQTNRILDYLLQNQLKVPYDSLLKIIDDEAGLKKYFYDSINKDTAFTNSLTTLMSNYLSTQGLMVSQYHYDNRYTVSIDKIAAIVARFFFPNKLVDGGKSVSMKLCVSDLSFKDYDGKRNFLEEAFAFSVVAGSVQSDDQALIEEYKKEANFAINMNLSYQEDVKLNRFQGAVWALLSKNKKVIEKIKEKYDEQKNILPFSLTF